MGGKKNIVIVDLDGTLALDEHRIHHLRDGKWDWDSYLAGALADAPNHPVVQLVRILKFSGKQIYILSARLNESRSDTMVWLDLHSVPYDHLELCMDRKRCMDPQLKVEWLDSLDIRSRVWLVLEDRKKMVDAWRNEGLTCLQVAPGDF